MTKAWLQIKGLHPKVSKQDLATFTRGKVLELDLFSKRILVKNMDDAFYILEHCNFSFIGYFMFKASLEADDLCRCRMILIKNLKRQPLAEEKLYQYSKQFGVVCGIDVEGDLGKVWFRAWDEARSMIDNLDRSGLCNGDPVYKLFDNVPWAADSRSTHNVAAYQDDCITIDSDNDNDNDNDDDLLANRSEGLTTKELQAARSMSGASQDRKRAFLDQKESGAAVYNNGIIADRKSRRHIALKSTGGRNARQRPMIDDTSVTGQLDFTSLLNELYIERPSVNEDRDPDASSRKKRAKGADRSKNGKRKPAPLQNNGDLLPLAKRAFGETDSSRGVDFRTRAPFIYQFIHMHMPSDIESTGSHCLSMAWNPARQRNKQDLFVSQGNARSVEDMRYICYSRGLSDDSRSTVVQYPFEIPKRFDAESALSPIHTFTSSAKRPACVANDKDDNTGPVVSLKLYDEGRILLGCSTYGVMVWTVDPIKHKETLILIDDVSGVYDVGSNYIVANSISGEMGVWKAGSANYIWRYNDTRKYRSSSSSLLGEYQLPTIITALKIAPNDLCTYVGNSRGVLSMSDFREPYIQDLGVVQRDGICSIELIGEQQILVGTQSGDIELYDVRFARNDGKPGPLRSFKLPTDTAASQIQACPSSPHRVFACSSGKNVYIYLNEVDSGALPVFTHLGHQTAVADFRWHPGQGYDYTIGSIETGGESGRGLIQVWRPADLIVNDWQLGRT